MLADEGLVFWVVELVVVPRGMGYLETGDVLESRREGAVGGDVLVEVLPVFIFIVVEGDQEDVAVYLSLPLHPLLVPLLQFLHLLWAPA